MSSCRICGSNDVENVILHSFRKKIRDSEWVYFRCRSCGCLQIDSFPSSQMLETIYDNEYESFRAATSLVDKLFLLRSKAFLSRKYALIGKMANWIYPYGDLSFLQMIHKTDAVLDVGCGQGTLVSLMKKCGYSDVTGIDPHLKMSDASNDSYNLVKSDIQTLSKSKKYKLIMFNSTLEHMENQHEVVRCAKDLLDNNAIVSVTVPIVTDYIWKTYGEVNDTLDPPVHMYLHTKESLLILFESEGFELIKYKNTISPSLQWFFEMESGDKSPSSAFDKVLRLLLDKRKNTIINKKGDGNIGTFIFKKGKVQE